VTLPLAYTIPVGLAFWATFVWAFLPESRVLRQTGPKTVSLEQDRGSYRAITRGQGIAFFFAFLIATNSATAIRSNRAALYWLGIALLIAGSLLRRHCFRILGEQFTGVVRVRDEDQVIERGAYRWIRHPSYTAALIMYTGIGLALGNWASLAISLGVSIVVYGYRIYVEEQALLAKHGERYRAYTARTRRLIPYLF
jgi:protein-S-isoprenylcysteine O-methyltransferase Ste14